MNVLRELGELDAYLEGIEDIDNNGGPNTAMRVRQILAEAIPTMAAIIEALEASLGAYEALAVVGAASHLPGYAHCVRSAESAIARARGE